jgi:hypothetical protein
MTDPPFAKGSCRCGAIRLTINAKPRMMVQCHCLDCQKATGTGHTSNAYFADKDVAIEGESAAHTVMADSGSEMTRYFCPECGSRMYGHNSEKPGLISIEVGCLDDQSWFVPQAILFSSRRHDWDITSDEIANFDEMQSPQP